MRRRSLWSGHQRSISSSRSRRGLSLLIFFVAGLGSNNNRIVVAQDANPRSAFTFPTEDGMTLFQKDTILVSYVSSFPDPGLYAWCRDDKGGINNVYTNDHAASFNGTQPVLINFTFDNGDCWWNLRRQFESPDGANSPTFRLADTEREGGSQTISRSSSSTTSSTPTSSANSRQTGASTLTTMTSSSTTSSSTATSTNGVSSNTSSSSPNDSGGLSTAAAAGIGVAVGVVVVVFLIALVIWMRKWKSNVIAEAVKATQSGGAGGGSPGTGAASLQGMGELGGGGSPYPVPVPVYAGMPSVNNPDMGHVRTASATAAEAAGGVKYYYPMHGSEGISRAPEEMDSDRHTAEMEGDNTYGRKFQGRQYH